MSKDKIKLRSNGDVEFRCRLNFKESLAVGHLAKEFGLPANELVKRLLIHGLQNAIYELAKRKESKDDEQIGHASSEIS